MVCGKRLSVKQNDRRVECPKCDSIMRWENIEDMIIVK